MFIKTYSRWVTSHPCWMFGLSMLVIILGSFASYSLGYMQIADSTAYDMVVETALPSQSTDAMNDALNNLEFVQTISDDAKVNRTDVFSRGSVQLLYHLDPESKSKTLFNPTSLQEICKFEKMLLETQGYEDVCLKLSATEDGCVPQSAMLSMFVYRSNPSEYANCDPLPQGVLDGLISMMSQASLGKLPPQQAQQLLFFVDKGFAQPESAPISDWVIAKSRSLLLFGGPLEEGLVPADASPSVIDAYYQETYFSHVKEAIFERFEMKSAMLSSAYNKDAIIESGEDEIEVLIYNLMLQREEFRELISGDLSAALFSFIIVLVILCAYTRSLFLGCIGMFQIIMSIPFGLFICGAVLQIPYFGQMHILSVFLILGVGADDIFVYVDKWKLTHPAKETAERVEETLAHTLAAVFNTSLTTAVAFFATGLSPVMTISAFGYFAAVAILMNYIFVVTVTPATVALWHTYFEHSHYFKLLSCNCVHRNKIEITVVEPVKPRRPSLDDEPPHVNPGFWGGVWAPLLNFSKEGSSFKPYSFLVTTLLISLTAVLGYHAAILEKPVEEEAFFGENHMLTKVLSSAGKDYVGAEASNYNVVHLCFGLEGIDRTGFSRWNPGENRGSAVYDSSFSLNDKQSQLDFVSVCNMLSTKQCEGDECTIKSLVLPGVAVPCVIEEFLNYQANKQNKTIETMSFSEGDAFGADLRSFLTDPTSTGPKHSNYVGFEEGTNNVKMVYISITTALRNQQPYGITRPYYDFWMQTIDEIEETNEKFGNVIVADRREFGWMITQEKLVEGMLQGLAISLPVAFVVLVFATMNLIISFLAIFSIASIVACVLGIAQLMGWSLGLTETIAAVIVIGFSVDYTVHLGHVYEEAADRHHRGKRVTEALEHMGHTVVGGAITTFSSGAVMFLCQLSLFFKMAVLICLTISLSCVFSLGFYMAILAQIGPENDTGDIGKCCRKSKVQQSPSK